MTWVGQNNWVITIATLMVGTPVGVWATRQYKIRLPTLSPRII